MNDEHCQKLERNEKTAERQTKGNDEYGSPEQKISPQGLEPWSTGSINTMHSLNLIRRSASASVWLLMWISSVVEIRLGLKAGHDNHLHHSEL